MLQKYKSLIVSVIPFVVVTVIFGTMYTVVQHVLRIEANDPQIQIAEDTTHFFSQGGQTQDIAALYPQINFAESLAPFVMVFDASGMPLLSTGNMNGSQATIPHGVLAYVAAYGEDRFTWQPQSGVRIAAVVAPYAYNGTSGFVLAGRNLREVEMRENSTLIFVFIGWIVSVLGLLLFTFLKRQ